MFGAVLPDLPALIVGFIEWFKYVEINPNALNWRWIVTAIFKLLVKNEIPPVVATVWTKVGYYQTSLWFRQCLHSIVFWAVVVALVYLMNCAKGQLLPLAWGALFFHILVDWLTHKTYAHDYLWPISDVRPRGFIAHDNPLLLKVEVLIWSFWFLSVIAWLIRKPTTSLKK